MRRGRDLAEDLPRQRFRGAVVAVGGRVEVVELDGSRARLPASGEGFQEVDEVEAVLLREVLGVVVLLAAALRQETPRRPTRATRASKQRRLEEKKRQGLRKQERAGRMAPE